MQNAIELLFRERDYWASIVDGVFILASFHDIIIPNKGAVPEDFVNFTREVSEKTGGESINGRAIFSREVNVENNNFKDKFGKWRRLVGHEPDKSYIHLLNMHTILVYEQGGIDLISSNSEPIYDKKEISRKVEDIDGTFPVAHSLVFPKDGGGFYTARIPGYLLKIAIEFNSTIQVGPNMTRIDNSSFTAISGNLTCTKGRPELNFTCGGKTMLNPDDSSWLTEDNCLKKIMTCERAFNILKEPPRSSSLSQMCKYWAGAESHQGIEGLMWNGWDEDQILTLIADAMETKQKEFGYYRLDTLISQDSNNLSGFERRKFLEKSKEVEQIFLALSERGLQITGDALASLGALDYKRQELIGGNNGFC